MINLEAVAELIEKAETDAENYAEFHANHLTTAIAACEQAIAAYEKDVSRLAALLAERRLVLKGYEAALAIICPEGH